MFDSAGVRVAIAREFDQEFERERYTPTGLVEADDGTVLIERKAQVATNGVDRVYISEPSVPRVRVVVVGTGRSVDLGRGGGGPGEYRFPAFLRLGTEGELQIVDQARLRLIQYDSAGDFHGEADLAEIGFPHGPVVLRGDTALWLSRDPTEWVLYRSVGGARSALASVGLATKGRLRFACGDGNVTLSDPPMRFAPGLVWDEQAGELVVAAEDQYQVSVFAGGRLRGLLRRSVHPVVPTVSHLERAYPAGLTVEIGPRKCTLRAETLTELLGVMPSLPQLSGLLWAPNRTLWVERFALPDEDPIIDIYDVDLRYLGSLTGVGRPVGFLSAGRVLSMTRTEDFGVFALAVFQGQPPRWE